MTRVRGKIVSFNGKTLTVHRHSGDTVTIALPADVRPGGSAQHRSRRHQAGRVHRHGSEDDRDGHLIAQELVVFPEAERGTGEGHYAWDLGPSSTMTNANVDAVVEGTQGRDLHLSYKGGKNVVTVPTTVPVVKFVPASKADLLAGKQVFVVARGDAQATHFEGERIVVEKDGVKPPM